ncbi:MAG: AAA family ATPase [Crocosphaera sp.]|nr:AAA family ATPase [Crocosphaera sp.]
MVSSSLDQWQKTNREYLIQSVALLRHSLELQLGIQSKQPLKPPKEPENTALKALCTQFNLSPFERDILLLGVGMEIDPSFGDLCAQLQGKDQLDYPTLALALASLPNASFSVISPQSPLLDWQLIEFGTASTLTKTPFRIDHRILCYLLGEYAQDTQLQIIDFSLPPGLTKIPLSPSQSIIVHQCRSTWLEATSSYPVLQFCGLDSITTLRLAIEVSRQLNSNLAVLPASLIPQQPSEVKKLQKRWEREAILSDTILLIQVDDQGVDSPQQNLNIFLFIENLRTAVIISSRDRLYTKQKTLLNFDVPSLSYDEQITLWEKYLEPFTPQLNGHISKLTSQFNLSPSLIIAACNSVKINLEKIINEEENNQQKIYENLWYFCRTQARPHLHNLAQRIDTKAAWKDLVLPKIQQQTLAEMLSSLRQRSKVIEEWGFANIERRGLGISALFYGSSGTGKTMAAAVIANALNVDLYRIDLSAVVSKYIGETEKNLRRIFDAAETGGAILLFDEADALFGKRTQVKDSHDRHANVEVSYLLQRMETYQGLAILTTNLKDALDTAFLRRIRFVVAFPFPDKAAREEIWRRVFPSQTPTESLDFQTLAKLNVAGGNIRNIALNAAFLAADNNEAITMKHILQAAKNEYLKLERSLSELESIGRSLKLA